jgi:hypothetical protein
VLVYVGAAYAKSGYAVNPGRASEVSCCLAVAESDAELCCAALRSEWRLPEVTRNVTSARALVRRRALT